MDYVHNEYDKVNYDKNKNSESNLKEIILKVFYDS